MYMTGDEIRALSRRIPAVVNATPEELTFWMEEAFDVINSYCQQDFVLEKQVTKQVRATTNTLVLLPKVLSGDVSVATEGGSPIYTTYGANTSTPTSYVYTDTSGAVVSGSYNGYKAEVFPGTFHLGYYVNNETYRSPSATPLQVTGDWGWYATKQDLLNDGVNTLVALYDAHRQDTNVHLAADVTNVTTSPAATDLASAILLANEFKAIIEDHFNDDLVAHSAIDDNIPTAADATDETSLLTLIINLKEVFNAHLANSTVHVETDNNNIARFSTDAVNSVMPSAIRRVFLRLVQRLAIRDDAEDHRQINSVYANETLGDGYSYDLSNGTLRNLIRPEEAMMLLPYINRGRVVI